MVQKGENKNNLPEDPRIEGLYMSKKDVEKYKDSSFDLEKEEDDKKKAIKETYYLIQEAFKKYVDMREDYYPLVSLWIIGTYFHNHFLTYPYLYFNAMKGSGKTRALGLIAHLSRKGKLVANMTESVLFRTAQDCTICIDEFESNKSKEKANLRELLNAGYKRGMCVERAKKVKKKDSEDFEIERFDVFAPIAMANISGMDEVLGDRSVKLVLETTPKDTISRKLEIWGFDGLIRQILKKLVSFSDVMLVNTENLYKYWNLTLDQHDTRHLQHNMTLNGTRHLFKKIQDSSLNGRNLELFFPLFILAHYCDDLDNIVDIAERIVKEKKEEDVFENRDISLIQFISEQQSYGEWVSQKILLDKFKAFIDEEEIEWLNPRWFGIALSRLKLIKDKRRLGKGREVILNIGKAQEKLKIFK